MNIIVSRNKEAKRHMSYVTINDLRNPDSLSNNQSNNKGGVAGI